MPPKRARRAKNPGPSEISSSSEPGHSESQSAKPSKRRKDEKVENAVVESVQSDGAGNGKKTVSRKGKAGSKRKKEPSADEGLLTKGAGPPKPKAKKTLKENVVKTKENVDKSRSNKRPRQGAEMLIVEKRISHFSHQKTPGSVLVMGQGDCGQLGLGESLTERKKPYPVKGDLSDKKVVQVECGGMHTIALTTDGKVYTWGCNDEGSLGYSTSEGEVFTPCQVKALDSFNVVQVSAGDCHSVALVDNGNVYSWGVFRDSNGPFGMVDSLPSLTPQLVYNSFFNPAVKIASGDNHVIVLTEKGDVYTFGSGEQGQLGRLAETFCSRGGRHGLRLFFTPQSIRVDKKRGAKVPQFDDIFAGSYNSFAVSKERNSVYVWGLNNYGQLGIGNNDIKYSPEKVPEDWLWSWGKQQISSSPSNLSIDGGMHHTLVMDNGCVYAMGSKNYGRLGLGRTEQEPNTPTEISSIKNIVGVACGGSYSFAISSKGDLYSWGMGSTLQLGQGDEEDYWEPAKVSGKNLEGKKVIGVSCGGQHTALLVTGES